MSLLDLIEQHGGANALGQIGARVGLSPEQVNNVLGALAPALGGRIEQQAQAGQLPPPPAGAGQVPQPGSDEAEAHGGSVLGSIFGGHDATHAAAADAGAQTGLPIDKVKSVLPQLAGIAAAAFLAHKASSEGKLGGF